MRKLVALLCPFIIVATLVAGDNLLSNGDFEQKGSAVYSNYKKDTWETDIHTEDGSWNKCYRMTLCKIVPEAENVRKVYAMLLIGRTGELIGIPVKPDTTYEFSCEVRGTVPGVGVKATLWSSDDPNIWEGGRTVVSVTWLAITGEWQRHRGTFRTGSDTRRAALTFNFWGDSSQQPNFGFAEGQVFMLDNVSMREKPSLDTAPDSTPNVNSTPAATATFVPPAKFTVNQVFQAFDRKSLYPTEVTLRDGGDALLIEAACQIPPGEKPRDGNRADGKNIWREGDVLEFFFSHRQFAIGAGGGRYGDLPRWQAETARSDAGWTVRARFPYALIGEKTVLDFNIARSSVNNQSASLAPVKDGFGDRRYFCRLVFPEYRETLRAEWRDIPGTLSAERDRVLDLPLCELYGAAAGLRAKIRHIRLGNAKFLLGTREPSADPAEPLEVFPENVVDGRTPLTVRGAINESVPLVLTLTNRTARTENYQVTLHKNSPKNQFEELNFPPGEPRVEIRRGVLMKEDDSSAPTRRYDALVKLDQAGLIVLAPGESSLLWLTFDMRNAGPGRYLRNLRITPLSEPAKVDSSSYVSGAMLDFPLEVEVLNIRLQLEPAAPVWIMTRGATNAIFDFYTELGGRMVMVSPYVFKLKTDASGRRITEAIDLPGVRCNLERYRARNIRDSVKFLVGYSAYQIFAKLNPQFQPLTPEWREAWRDYLLMIDASFRKLGLTGDDWMIQLFDEPLLESMECDLEVAKIAHETLPDTRRIVTWCVDQGGTGKKRHQPEHIRKFAPYITDHCFWHGLLDRANFQQLVTELKARGSRCGFYACSTSLRLPLYDYYRLHAWKAWEAGATAPIGLYCLMNCAWGQEGATSWKLAESGGIVYRYGDDCVPSIRSEVLRQGLTDLKYLKLLEAVPEAQAYLRDISETILKNRHDPDSISRFREQAVKYLLDQNGGK